MMKRIIVLASIIFVVVAAVSAHGAKAPKNSFLVSSVATVDQLAQQVINDATVAARYAKHYKMSRNAVVDYFQKNLRIGKLTKDYETTVYYIHERTDISSEKRTLFAGSYVFVAADGTPMLEGSTGNPLGDSLPSMMFTDSSAASTPESSLQGLSSVDGPEALIAADGDVVTKVLGTQPAELGVAVTGIGAMEPAIELVSAIPVSAAPSAAFGAANLRLLIPAAAILGGAAMAGGGDSGRSPAPANVPEPGSLVALALGASGILLPKLRRLRKA